MRAATVAGAREDNARGRHLYRRPRLRLLLGAVCVPTVLTLALCGSALADSATLSITNTAGESDPAAGLPRIFTLSGTTEVSEHAFVKYRAVGGEPCAPNASEDPGNVLGGDSGDFYGIGVEGIFADRSVMTWNMPGTFMFCIWLAPEVGSEGSAEQAIVVPITQTITFRSPHGTISAIASPLHPEPGQQTTITVTGASEAPENVYAKIRPAGGTTCAADFDGDPGESLIEEEPVSGDFAVRAKVSESKAGKYLICLWLAGSGEEVSAIAGPQPVVLEVGTQPTPAACIVPSALPGESLHAIENAIKAAHCSVGKVSHVGSTTVRGGEVIAFSSAPGTRLPVGTRIGIVVSAGPPCIVPRVRRYETLATAKRSIQAAHCRLGSIRHAANHAARGTVIALKPASGRTLAPRAPVQVIISEGPRIHRRHG